MNPRLVSIAEYTNIITILIYTKNVNSISKIIFLSLYVNLVKYELNWSKKKYNEIDFFIKIGENVKSYQSEITDILKAIDILIKTNHIKVRHSKVEMLKKVNVININQVISSQAFNHLCGTINNFADKTILSEVLRYANN